ncbi:hypothetical protein GJ496_011870 [Pomphorhynchus laevis]|nr:hypothetical protein GJ496_011870 [Pomphorhynchus laevis]
MGNHGDRCNRPLTNWEIHYLASSLNIDPSDVLNIYHEFNRVCGRDGQLSPREFRRLYKRLYPASRMTRRQLHRFTKRVYAYCDRDGSGGLTFNEFIAVLVMIEGSGTPRDKMNFIFHCTSPTGQSDMSSIPTEDLRYILNAMDSIYNVDYSSSICSAASYEDSVPYSEALDLFDGGMGASYFAMQGDMSSSDYSSDD